MGTLFLLLFLQLIADGNFAVNRRICINPTSARWTKRQWVGGVDPSTINVLIGTTLMILYDSFCNEISTTALCSILVETVAVCVHF